MCLNPLYCDALIENQTFFQRFMSLLRFLFEVANCNIKRVLALERCKKTRTSTPLRVRLLTIVLQEHVR